MKLVCNSVENLPSQSYIPKGREEEREQKEENDKGGKGGEGGGKGMNNEERTEAREERGWVENKEVERGRKQGG